MSDLAETFRLMKERNKAKKLSNLEYSTQLLIDKGIEFKSKNGGVHLIVSHNGIIADFWPSTGKFQIRGKGYSRGVKNLLNQINQLKVK